MAAIALRGHALLLMLLGGLIAGAQGELRCDSIADWAPKEARWWNDFQGQTRHWNWTPALQAQLFEAVCISALQLEAVAERMERAETAGAPGLADSLQAFRSEQERIRGERDAAFMAAVPMAWWPEVQAVLNPPKPTVLNFGVHDRMKCAVCVPGAAE